MMVFPPQLGLTGKSSSGVVKSSSSLVGCTPVLHHLLTFVSGFASRGAAPNLGG